MKKRVVLAGLERGSAAYVIAHARWRRSRGKKDPSLPYKGELNPRKALALAKQHVALQATAN